MYTLTVEKKAQAEFETGYYYYLNFVNERVAIEFAGEYEKALSRIFSFPEMYPDFSVKYKKYVFRKFKHTMYYRIDKSKIRIVAILHQSTDMNKLMTKR